MSPSGAADTAALNWEEWVEMRSQPAKQRNLQYVLNFDRLCHCINNARTAIESGETSLDLIEMGLDKKAADRTGRPHEPRYLYLECDIG